MAFSRYACAVDHLFKVGQVLASISPVWGDTWTMLLLLSIAVATSFAASLVPFVFPVVPVLLFLFSGRCPIAAVLIRRSLRSGFLLSRRLLDLKGRRQFTLLDQALLEQVVHCRHLVVLVAIEALSCVVFLEAVAFKVSEKRWFNGNLVLADDQTLALAHRLICLVPRVLLDLVRSQPLVRVCFENLVYQVDTVCG